MSIIIPTFTVVPSPTDTRADFSAKAFQLASEYNPVITKMNEQNGENNALASSVEAAKNSAIAARIGAEAAANAASAAANAQKWVSGTTYTQGQVVWSPTKYLSYRRKTNGAGTTDPALDSANWAPLMSEAFGIVTNAGSDPFVAVPGRHYLMWSGNSCTLPSTPAVGDTIFFSAYSSPGWSISPNGKAIQGVSGDMVVDMGGPGQLMYTFGLRFVEDYANTGWAVIT